MLDINPLTQTRSSLRRSGQHHQTLQQVFLRMNLEAATSHRSGAPLAQRTAGAHGRRESGCPTGHNGQGVVPRAGHLQALHIDLKIALGE